MITHKRLMTRWQWQCMTMMGDLYLFNVLKVCCLKCFRIFAKSFVYPISPYFTPFFGLDNDWNVSLCPRSGKRTYEELSTEAGEREDKSITLLIITYHYTLFFNRYLIKKEGVPKLTETPSSKKSHQVRCYYLMYGRLQLK